MMKRMNLSETIFLFFLALIIFGPKKLPEIARQIGKYMNEFRRASNEFKSQIEQEIAHLEVEKNTNALPSSPPVEGVTSRSAMYESSTASNPQPEAEIPATLAATEEDEPLFATKAGSNSGDPIPATEAAAHSEDVTSPSSQESHV
jgi:sec-independent protein translocase protein TatB